MTPEVIKGGKYFNEKRVEAGLPEVYFVMAELVENTDKNDKLSSTHIREIISSKFSLEELDVVKQKWSVVGKILGLEQELLEKW